MLRYIIAFVALTLVGLVLHVVAAEESPPKPYRMILSGESDRQEIAQIKGRIEELRGELDQLALRLEVLEAKPRFFSPPTPAPKLPEQPIPPEWERRKFNGRDVYIIPLGQEPRAINRR
jgi:hypothetical protein